MCQRLKVWLIFIYMANNYSDPFYFKQFKIYQQKSAMKIGTDALLIGAWTHFTEPLRILDVGTGTGVLALMMAQRFNRAFIDAIDIDESAVEEAIENAQSSVFHSRIHVKPITLQNLETEKYDLIISNPPFFKDSLPNPNQQRSLARHTGSLSFQDLAKHTVRLLNKNGQIALIVSTESEFDIKTCFSEFGFYATRITRVKSYINSIPHRLLIQLKWDADKPVESELIIYEKVNQYTTDYKKLVAEFLLNVEHK